MNRVYLPLIAVLLALPGPASPIPQEAGGSVYRPGDPALKAPQLRWAGPAARPVRKTDGPLWDLMASLRDGPTESLPGGLDSSRSRVRPDGAVQVYVYCSAWDEQKRAALAERGFKQELISMEPRIVVQGWLPCGAAEAVERLPFVKQVTLPAYPILSAGSVTAQSDSILKCATARSVLGSDGSGVRVGILSDSIDARASAQATGDLPPDADIYIGKEGSGRNEGTAMMEVVHDLAPGARLGFYAAQTSLEMAVGIQDLAAQGCKVICDDLTFLDQPCFEPGNIESAISNAVRNGVTYVTPAGNFGQSHYAKAFDGVSANIAGVPLSVHNYGNLAPEAHKWIMPVNVPAGGKATVYIQWNAPWGAAADDYDLYLTSMDATQVFAASENVQNGSQNPVESATVHNPGTTDSWVGVVVSRFSGAARNLKVYVLEGGLDSRFVTPAGSIGFNNKAADALTVGAISAGDPGHDTIAGYSGQGPCVTVAKPDVTGIDGVSVTGAGGFATSFTGTSAAAAGVAGVCALTLAALPAAEPATIRRALTSSAADRGAPGGDTVYGWGLADALGAVTLAQSKRLVFAQEPRWGVPNTAFHVQPAVRVERYDGSLDTTCTSVVSIAIAPGSGPAGAVLKGATLVKAGSGIAAFGGLMVDRAGAGYALTASSMQAGPARTANFDVGIGTVVTWGNDSRSDTGDAVPSVRIPRPSILTGAKQVSTGAGHTLALKEDGTVWSWGDNSYGQLGDGTRIRRLVPVPLPDLKGVVALSAGAHHSLALKDDGTVWAWGSNSFGELGDGTRYDRSSPAPVTGLTDVVFASAGLQYSLAVKRDGTVWAWGRNEYGTLGDGTTESRYTPVQVTDLTGVVTVAAGWWHSLAVTADGSVWAWGYGGFGALGDGGRVSTVVPLHVEAITGAAAVSAGYGHTLALKRDGSVWAWGAGSYGQLGRGNNLGTPAPTEVPSLANVVALSAGAYHSVAVDDRGAVWVWGRNSYGEIGDGTYENRNVPTPVRVSGPSVGTSAGEFHTTVLTDDGSIWAWGFNTEGQLGDGTSLRRSAPVPCGGLAAATQFAGGDQHSLALKGDGTVWTWGTNDYGQLGDNTNVTRNPPVPVPGLTNVTNVGAGLIHSLAVKADGTAWAWGYGSSGQLGDGTTQPSRIPVQVSGLTNAVQAAGGIYHSVAVKRDGSVWAWGNNSYGQLGDGSGAQSPVPVQVSGLTDVAAVSAGIVHSLALKNDGTVWAWGTNWSGQLGDGSTIDHNVPVQVTGLTGAVAIAAGASHSLALKSDGTLWAWGAGWAGQLGDSQTGDRNAPVQVAGLTGVIRCFGGGIHSLALKSDGSVWAWGGNESGQLGDGTYLDRSLPVRVTGLAGVTVLGAGYQHSFGASGGPLASRLSFRSQPVAGSGLTLASQPVIEVLGSDGSVLTDYSAPVAVYVKPLTGASGSYLTGTTTVNFVGGVATFAGLGLSKPGAGYVLRAALSGLTEAESGPFTVTGPFTWSDVRRSMRIHAGLSSATAGEMPTLGVVEPAGLVDLLDASRIARKVAGLEANP